MADLRLLLPLLLAATLSACAVGETAPPRMAAEPVAAPESADPVPAAAPIASAEPAPVVEAEPPVQERWGAPFAVRSSGRPAPREPQTVVVLAPPSKAAVGSVAAADSAPATAPAAAASTAARPPAARPRAAAAVRTHRVEWSETWYGIARRYSVSPAALATANPDVDPEKLRAGEVLSIPAAVDSAVARTQRATRTHRVGPGDSLWGIARRYGVSIERLRIANRLRDDRVRLGQTLTIPAPDPVR